MTTTPPPPPPATPTRAFTILAVCTGNICRSPAMERWLAAGLTGVDVSSAGARAVVGHPIDAQMVPFIVEGSGKVGDFAARQLTAQMIRDADLVLTAARGHRSAVLELVPAAVRRTFTLREFARLASLVDRRDLDAAAPPGSDDGARLAALVPLAVRRRGQVIVEPERDDVIDPVGRSDAVFARAAGQMRPAVETILRVVHWT